LKTPSFCGVGWGGPDTLQQLVFQAEQTYNRFLQQLEDDYPAYYDLKYTTNEPPQVAEVQAALANKQLLIEYFVGQDSIYTFAIGKADMELFALPKPTGFADSVTLYRELVTNGIEQDCMTEFIRLSRWFYGLLLFLPVTFADDAPERLVIIPDGLLNFLSFESLLYKDIDRLRGVEGFLIERFATSYAYSSKLLLEEQFYPRSANKGFVGFGLEYDDATLDYLKDLEFGKVDVDTTFQNPCGAIDTTRYLGKLTYSDDEVEDIAAITGGDSWLNEDVRKDIFMDVAGDYQQLHLAMHGSYDLEFPMNSSLLFTHTDSTDVFLRAAEIYGMELAGEMVVLSACNTAYGKLQAGEGPMTLARAFHYAGIPAVVATLWSLPDNSASKIMRLFYEELDQGHPKDIALRNAKLAYLADDNLSSPITRQPAHWAPAVVIGDISPVASRWKWWHYGLGLAFLGLAGWMIRSRGSLVAPVLTASSVN
ncbi:MAG: CHAT domain-containing protein, partial [Bacteroidota bacterium]